MLPGVQGAVERHPYFKSVDVGSKMVTEKTPRKGSAPCNIQG